MNINVADKGKNLNVFTGCSEYSDGCRNCWVKYETFPQLMRCRNSRHWMENEFTPAVWEKRITQPLRWRNPRYSFITEVGDPAHEDLPDSDIIRVMNTLADPRCAKHILYFLTKRSKRMTELFPKFEYAPWIWMGVTVESYKYVDRIKYLQSLPEEVNKWIMFEPLISDMPELDLTGIQWIVIGGESAPDETRREMKEEWAENIITQARTFNIPVLYKHGSSVSQRKAAYTVNGRSIREFPVEFKKRMGKYPNNMTATNE